MIYDSLRMSLAMTDPDFRPVIVAREAKRRAYVPGRARPRRPKKKS